MTAKELIRQMSGYDATRLLENMNSSYSEYENEEGFIELFGLTFKQAHNLIDKYLNK